MYLGYYNKGSIQREFKVSDVFTGSDINQETLISRSMAFELIASLPSAKVEIEKFEIPYLTV